MAMANAIPSWQIVDYDFDTILLCVAFSDSMNGFLPYMDNGSGDGVKLTTDGGNTWTIDTDIAPNTVMLMDCAAKSNNAVMGGLFSQQYSIDSGNTWTKAKGPNLLGQSCEGLRDRTDKLFFGVTGGDVLGGNGVAISQDGGASYKFLNISVAETLMRYGAFPSANVWYMTAGMWPSTLEVDDTIVAEQSQRIRFHKDVDGGIKKKYLDINGPTPRVGGGSTTADGWSAQILKTVDGGATFTSVFYSTGEFYFNGIDCEDETHCCAVGEADSGVRTGVRIWCTADGTNWNEVYFQSDPADSLMAIRALGNGEWWAGGGHLASLDFQGFFPHSVDGGKTWSNATLMKVYADDLYFIDNAHGWATTLDRDSQSGLIKYA